MNNHITAKEKELLASIVNSEYQDGGDPAGHHVWLDYIVDSKSRGGVLTSLQKKGCVELNIVSLSKSYNRKNGISDSTVAITETGIKALLEVCYFGLEKGKLVAREYIA